MHYGRIMLARKDISSPAHIGSELIDFVHPLHYLRDGAVLSEIADDEFVGNGRGIFVRLKIDATNPIAFVF